MSIAWMSEVFAGRRPRSTSERLMLLALADNANDQGVCWPSMRHLATKCALSLRQARRMVAQLESDGFLRREEIAGKPTRYHLLAPALSDDLSTTLSTELSTAGQTPDMGDRGEGVPRTRTTGVKTRDPGHARPPTPDIDDRGPRTRMTGHKPSKNHQLNQQQQHARPRARGREPSALGGMVADAAAAFSKRDDLRKVLVGRGIDVEVAGQLVGQAAVETIEALVARYDREGGHTPGWLVTAIRERWSAGQRTETRGGLLGYQEALKVFEGLGGRFDEHFEPVKQGDGSTLFRRKQKPGVTG